METHNLTMEDVDKVVPHQASRARPFMMQKLGIPKGKFIDKVSEYGNMVAASMPYALCEALEEGTIEEGDHVLFPGTAAGMTMNLMLWHL